MNAHNQNYLFDRKLDESDSIFDGFMHRPFNEDLDGWRNEQLSPPPIVEMARQILDLYTEVNELRRENWQLRKILGVSKC